MNTNKREEEKKFVDNVELQNNNYKIYKKQVAELKETYLDLMDDYNEYHILIINSPSNVEYKQHYENIKMNIDEENGTLQCHVCGKYVKDFVLHIRSEHSISPMRYREIYKIPEEVSFYVGE